MSLDSDIALIKGIPLFGELPTEQLRLLAFSAVRLDLAAGHVLFREGAKATSGYVVSSGGLELALGEGKKKACRDDLRGGLAGRRDRALHRNPAAGDGDRHGAEPGAGDRAAGDPEDAQRIPANRGEAPRERWRTGFTPRFPTLAGSGRRWPNSSDGRRGARRAISRLSESRVAKSPSSLFLRNSGRKTGSHFSWNCSRRRSVARKTEQYGGQKEKRPAPGEAGRSALVSATPAVKPTPRGLPSARRGALPSVAARASESDGAIRSRFKWRTTNPRRSRSPVLTQCDDGNSLPRIASAVLRGLDLDAEKARVACLPVVTL